MDVHRDSLASSLVAIIVAISIAAQAGGHEPLTRLVKINGTRVHLRSGVPVQLDHNNVVLHLKNGALFSVDRISLGLSATGVGADGTWLHVSSVDDPETVGWVCARYVAEVAVPATPVRAEQAATETSNDPAAPRTNPAIIIVPVEQASAQEAALANNLLGIVNSLSNMLVLFVTTFGMRWLFGRVSARPIYVRNRAARRGVYHTPRAMSPHTNFYGKGWWAAGKR